MIYRWIRSPSASINPQVAGEELERIRVRHNGRLTPAAVVLEARNIDNPLHPTFEWNDAVAANSYRVEQAKYLIRSIEVTFDEPAEAKPTRAFVSVVKEDARAYTSITDAMSDPEMRGQVLYAAFRELEVWRSRYAELEELAEVFASIDRARAA